MKDRMILHIDGDNFFASCLMAQDRSLRGKPIVVGAERGMVTALSIEAKALGVSRGMPIFQVKERFPSAIILAGDYALFMRISRIMHNTLGETSHALEKYSIDESFADITEVVRARRMSPYEVAKEVKNRLFKKTNQPFSVGVAPTKTLAKLVSTASKPDGLCIALNTEELSTILDATPVEKIWGVGSKSAVQLRIHGIYTAKELRDADDKSIAMFSKVMHEIRAELRGEIIHPISRTHALEKSMLSSLSFNATSNKEYIRGEFLRHIDLLTSRLREDGAVARKASFHVKDTSRRIHAIDTVLAKYEDTPAPFISALDRAWGSLITPNVLIRTTGVTLTDIISKSNETPSLFDTPDTKGSNVYKTVDSLRAKGINIETAATLGGPKKDIRIGFHPRI